MFKHSLNQSEANINLLVTNKRPEIRPLSSCYPWLRLALFSHKNTRVSALFPRFSLKAEQPGPSHYRVSLSRLSTLAVVTLPPSLQLPAAVIIITQRPAHEIKQSIF